VSGLDGRLKRLEGRESRCLECGLAPDERRPPAVIYEEHREKGFQGDPHERCASCGRPLWTVLRVVYG
jgi:hypothetical protein